ncbi:MAG: hypothetical protein R2686_02660 [Candidatus Nanopelagicales bacterium]
MRGPVTSPTFVIARRHPSLVGGPDLIHADAYRLGSAGSSRTSTWQTNRPWCASSGAGTAPSSCRRAAWRSTSRPQATVGQSGSPGSAGRCRCERAHLGHRHVHLAV